MKTERQVKDILRTVDKQIIDAIREQYEECEADLRRIGNVAPNCGDYGLCAVAIDNVRARQAGIHQLSDRLGYDWNRDIIDGVHRIRPHTVQAVRHKVTEGF